MCRSAFFCGITDSVYVYEIITKCPRLQWLRAITRDGTFWRLGIYNIHFEGVDWAGSVWNQVGILCQNVMQQNFLIVKQKWLFYYPYWVNGASVTWRSHTFSLSLLLRFWINYLDAAALAALKLQYCVIFRGNCAYNIRKFRAQHVFSVPRRCKTLAGFVSSWFYSSRSFKISKSRKRSRKKTSPAGLFSQPFI